MAPKGRAEGAGCVFPWKTRKGWKRREIEEKKEEHEEMPAGEEERKHT